jgi:hypothetical protein
MMAGDHDSCYLMSTVPVKEKLEAIEGKGDRQRRVGGLKVRRFRVRNGKLKKGCALIVQAAGSCGAEVIYSEDLADGQELW